MLRDAFTVIESVDVERLAAFYIDHLGFQPGYRWPDDGEPAFLVVSLDAFSIGVSRTESLSPAGRVAFWLYTEDVDREIERLRAAGVVVVTEAADMAWGERMATISDPDANLIHLGQRSGRKPADESA